MQASLPFYGVAVAAKLLAAAVSGGNAGAASGAGCTTREAGLRTTSEGSTAFKDPPSELHRLVLTGSVEAVKALVKAAQLKRKWSGWNVLDFDGNTVLHYAALNCAAMCDFILSRSNFRYTDNNYNQTPLSLVVGLVTANLIEKHNAWVARNGKAALF